MNTQLLARYEQEASCQCKTRKNQFSSQFIKSLILTLFMFFSVSMDILAIEPVRILPLGDSITQENNKNDSYRRPLWHKLVNAGYSVDFVGSHTTNFGGAPPNPDFDLDNEGHWGWRADELLLSLPGWLSGYTPDIVLMHVGSNDAFQSQSTASTVSELESIIDLFRAHNPNVIILLAQLIPAAESGRAQRVEQLNAEIPGIVTRKSQTQSPIYLVDHNSNFFVSELRDGVHAAVEGQNKMAEKWFEVLSPILSGTDQTAPKIDWLSTMGNPGKLSFYFDEKVSRATAENLANYQINSGVITAASLAADDQTVTLDISDLVEQQAYTLTVNNIQDQAVIPNTIEANSQASFMLPTTLSGRVGESLQLFYQFASGAGETVFDTSGVGIPMNLNINVPLNTDWLPGGGLALNAASFISMSSDTKLKSSLQASNEVSIEAWIRPANTSQTGPARIVTFSADGYNRNFTLGQRDNRYETRLRTTATNDNGSNIVTRTSSGVVDTTLSHLIFTRKATGETQFYENGALVASNTITGNFSNWSANHRFGLGDEDGDVSRPWLGDYHLVAVYDRALSSAEVLQNFTVGVEGSATGVPPLSDAGSDQNVLDSNADGSETISLNGTASSDDIRIISYQWYENGSLVAEGETPSINLSVGVHIISLVVTDNEGLTNSDEVTITVEAFTDSSPPSIPEGLSISLLGETFVTLTWAQAIDAESGIAAYRIYRNDVFVAETSNNYFNDTGLMPLSGYVYSVSAVNGVGLEGALSSALTVLTLLDESAPKISSLEVGQNGDSLVLGFNEVLDQISAETISHYQISPGLTVTMAKLQPDLMTVHLSVSPMAEGISYTLAVLGVLDKATTPNSSNDSVNFTYTKSPRVNNGLVMLYEFSAGSGATVYDVSGVGSPMNLNIDVPQNTDWLPGGGLALNAASFISMSSDTKLKSSLQASNEVSIEAWVRPANTTQTGPARIVTFSADGYNRNFTLGQRDNRYETRLRTTATNDNGSNIVTRTGTGVVDTNLSHLIFTRKATGETQIYENGILVASNTITGSFDNWNASYIFGLGNEAGSINRPWLGDYHLVAVYDRALSSNEILQNFAVGVEGTATGVPPLSDAGSNQNVLDSNADGSETISLNGAASSDDIRITSYQWYENGSLVAEGETPTLNLSVGVHTITLVVTDNEGLTNSDEVTITVEAFTDSSAPSIPEGLSISLLGETFVTLTWTQAIDAESGIAAYRLYRNDVFVAETSNNYFNDTGLMPLSSYVYSVSAVNGVGLEGTLSNALTVLTLLDESAPIISSLEVGQNGDSLVLGFNEVLDQISAETISHYQISPGLTVTMAKLQPDLMTVHLSVSPMAEGISYTLAVLGVLDKATTPNSSNDSVNFTYTKSPRVNNGLVMLYEFSAGSGATVYDVSGVGSPMNLTIDVPQNTDWLPGGGLALNAASFISMSSDTKLKSSLQASNEVSIEAWVRPANTTQTGPARIVTFSADGYNRNFTLGQRDNRYETRLRTTATNDNGSNIVTRTSSGVVDTNLSHLVFTRKATGETQIYENGILVASNTITGSFDNWNASYIFGLGNEAGSVSRPWLGDYHLVAVYDRALSSNEVLQNFAVGVD